MIIRRLTLVGATLTPIIPPIYATHVSVLNITNGSSDDLQVYSPDTSPAGDADKYAVVTAGFERIFPVRIQKNVRSLRPDTIAFYLKIAHASTTVLIWS